VKISRVIRNGRYYLIFDGGIDVGTISTTGNVTIGGDLTVQGNFIEQLDESLLGDLTMGTATQAGGDITVYKDGSGNKAFFLDASTGQLQLPTTGSGGGLKIGDVEIYESTSGVLVLGSGDSFGATTFSGDINVGANAILDLDYIKGKDAGSFTIQSEYTTGGATGTDIKLTVRDVDAASWVDVITIKGEPTGAGIDPYVLLGGNLDMSNASYDILIPDNQATALEIKEGTNAYITFNSTDGSERVTINKNMTAALNLTVSSSFYLDGQALWGLQADGNSLTIKGRTASAAQTDTIVIQTSNASHGVNFSDRIHIGGGAATVDIDILNANLDLGGNLLKTTTYYLNEVAGGIGVQKISDDSYVTLKAGDLNIQNAENAIKLEANAAKIKATNTDGYYATIWARDTGVGLVEVARFAGAADPYFSMGGSQEFKFTNGGLMGLFGATPVAQQAHIADADGTLADITTKFNSLLDKLEAYGLLATS